jgi:adenosylcobinamide-GDP ribazoletransferase
MRPRSAAAPAPATAPLRAVWAATAFLTRIPMPAGYAASGEMVAGAAAFPLVGAAIGGLLGGIAALAHHVLPGAAAAGIAVTAEVAVTGALHLDGLADSADGLGARGRERALAAMRDHSLGTYGVCALVLDLLLKTAALSALEPDPLPAAIAAVAISRAAPLPLAAALTYARPAEGTGRALSERLGWRPAALGVLIAAAVAAGAVGPQAAALLGAGVLVTAAFGVACKRRLGGVTGDTLGAAIELTSTTCLLLAAGLAR